MKSIIAYVLIVWGVVFGGAAICDSVAADIKKVSGQTVYLPVYHQFDRQGKMKPLSLALLISVRNTDLKHAVQIASLDYYDAKGRMKKRLKFGKAAIEPLEVRSLRIESESLEADGQMAGSFIIKWRSQKPATEPVCEAIIRIPGRPGGGVLLFKGSVIEE